MVGASSADIRLRGTVEAEGAIVKYTYKNMPSAITTLVSAGGADSERLYDLGGKPASKGLLVGKGRKIIK